MGTKNQINRHFRKLLSGMTSNGFTHKNKVILNLIQDLQRLLLLLLNSIRGRFQIKFGMTSLFNHGGFTLIELLVVVLIIAILAAVAVPQYQKAVEKSRFAEGLNLVHSIHQAQQLYKLEHGSFATALSQLDLKLPPSLNKTNSCHFGGSVWYNKDWAVRLGVYNQSNDIAEVTVMRNGGRYNCYGFTAINDQIYCAVAYGNSSSPGCRELFEATYAFSTPYWIHFQMH